MKRWINRICTWEVVFFIACYLIGRSGLTAIPGWRVILVSLLSAAVVLLFILGLIVLAYLVFQID